MPTAQTTRRLPIRRIPEPPPYYSDADPPTVLACGCKMTRGRGRPYYCQAGYALYLAKCAARADRHGDPLAYERARAALTEHMPARRVR